jgi:hypothetical protein
MEFPARNERHATQQEKKKQRRKTQTNQLVLRFFLQEMMHQRHCQLPIEDCRLPIVLSGSPTVKIGNRQLAIGNAVSLPSCG